jgi:hypothetical protein
MTDRTDPTADAFGGAGIHPLVAEGRALIEEIRAGVDALRPGPVDDVSAARLALLGEKLTEVATRRGASALAELAFSVQAVFSAAGPRRGMFTGSDLVFLRNVIGAAEEFMEAVEVGSPLVPSLELIGDGVEDLLDRLEAA